MNHLKQIMALLHVNQKELALTVGINASNISRILSGHRRLKPGGEAARRLAAGLFQLAGEKDRMDELCQLIGWNHEDTDKEGQIEDQILKWLFIEEKNNETAKHVPSGHDPRQTFATKLSAVMNLSNMTNVSLARRINVDPSYISRFRSGHRYPKSSSEIMMSICDALLDRIFEQGKMNHLAELADIPEEEIPNRKQVFSRLHQWLFNEKEIESGFGIEKLIESMQAFTFTQKPSLPPLDEIIDESILTASDQVYFGREGLQMAVIRFLGNALKQSKKDLFLFSNQNMNWMTGSQDFFLIWKRLMYECIKQGVHITIIHNLDRGLNEVTQAITSWLPFYLSGNIKSYYFNKEESGRFSTTMFLCPGMGCITGSNVAGDEDRNGIYRFDTEKELLGLHKKGYDRLLSHARRLAHIYHGQEYENLFLKEDAKAVWTSIPLISSGETGTSPDSNSIELMLREDELAIRRKADSDITLVVSHPTLQEAFRGWQFFLQS